MKWLRYAFEAAGLAVALALLKPLTPEAASNLGGFVCRSLGPRLRVSDRARQNLRLAMPELSDAEIARIIRDMWDNLGRVFAEYPHLGRITDPSSGRVVWQDMAPVEALSGRKGAAVLASGHLANWEVLAIAAAQRGIDITIIVREPNNPLVRRTIDRLRGVAGGGRVPKGETGAKQAISLLRRGRVLGLLFDQKLNRGFELPFFGIPAMTAAAPAQLAIRFRCPLIPVRIERTGPARFRMSAHPPISLPDTGDKAADAETAMRALNAVLEGWIRDRPAEWLWLHRRWPDQVYKEMVEGGRTE